VAEGGRGQIIRAEGEELGVFGISSSVSAAGDTSIIMPTRYLKEVPVCHHLLGYPVCHHLGRLQFIDLAHQGTHHLGSTALPSF
jgi:hypothetical protein